MDFIWLMVALVGIVIAVSIVFAVLAKVRMAKSLAARGVRVSRQFWRVNLKKIFKLSNLIFAIVFIFFLIYAVMLLFPVVWGFLSSLKSGGIHGEYFHNMFGLPTEWKFSNYVQAFETISDSGISFVGMFWNSTWFALGSAWITMEFTAAFAYVLNKYKFRGRAFLYGIALFMVSVPIGASMVSTYRLIYDLNLDNSMLILVTAANVYGMNLILTYAYWTNISWTYAEAAQIDGAGFYYTYFKIMRPQVLPLMFTLGLLAFITKWNDYMSPLLYLPDMPTLATGLYRFRSIAERKFDYPSLYAGMFICLLPILIIFAIFSDRLLGKVSMGGIKG